MIRPRLALAVLGFVIPFAINCALIGTTGFMMVHDKVKQPTADRRFDHSFLVRHSDCHQGDVPSDHRAGGTTGDRTRSSSNRPGGSEQSGGGVPDDGNSSPEPGGERSQSSDVSGSSTVAFPYSSF
ncbi:unnamed protein product [Caenorhabditis sp. 36 PRJEB53466]|nr:unnamed protein product [Caenorhabditis sp. 36 PRJEB53466]